MALSMVRSSLRRTSPFARRMAALSSDRVLLADDKIRALVVKLIREEESKRKGEGRHEDNARHGRPGWDPLRSAMAVGALGSLGYIYATVHDYIDEVVEVSREQTISAILKQKEEQLQREMEKAKEEMEISRLQAEKDRLEIEALKKQLDGSKITKKRSWFFW